MRVHCLGRENTMILFNTVQSNFKQIFYELLYHYTSSYVQSSLSLYIRFRFLASFWHLSGIFPPKRSGLLVLGSQAAITVIPMSRSLANVSKQLQTWQMLGRFFFRCVDLWIIDLGHGE